MRLDGSSGGLVENHPQVRRRWRYKLALRGAVGVLGLGVAVLLLSAYGLEVVALQRRIDRRGSGSCSAWR